MFTNAIKFVAGVLAARWGTFCNCPHAGGHTAEGSIGDNQVRVVYATVLGGQTQKGAELDCRIRHSDGSEYDFPVRVGLSICIQRTNFGCNCSSDFVVLCRYVVISVLIKPSLKS